MTMRAPVDLDLASANLPRHHESALTDYDRAHLVTYLRLLDADAADWREAARPIPSHRSRS
jgi:hypothetical protein